MKHDFIENNVVIFSKQTIDLLLNQKNPTDLLGLYCFYYYTAKWQKTNQPKATISYVSKALKWGNVKVRKNKKILLHLGLIEDVRAIDPNSKKVKGWYIKIKYLWKQENHPVGLGQGGSEKTTLSLFHTVEKAEPNAYSVLNIIKNNINALNANIMLHEKNSCSDVVKFSYIFQLDKMTKDGTDKRMPIIALYWFVKKIQIKNREQFQSMLKRELQPAKNLIGYDIPRIKEIMLWLTNNANFKWTLETVFKYIDEDLNKLPYNPLLSEKIKKGDWLCSYDIWHSRGQECGHNLQK